MIDDTKLERLAQLLHAAAEEGFTGNININFFKGGVTNIVKSETIKI